MAADNRNPKDFYILNTMTENTELSRGNNPGRNWQLLDLEANKEYDTMVKAQESGKLAAAMGESGVPVHLRGEATNFHAKRHMTKDIVKYKTEDGLVWIPKDKKADAKLCLNLLRVLDPKVGFHQLGLKLSQEEVSSPEDVVDNVPRPDLTKLK